MTKPAATKKTATKKTATKKTATKKTATKKTATKKTGATNPVDEDLASRNKKIESKTDAPKATDSPKKGGGFDWGMAATLLFVACIAAVLVFVAIKLLSDDDEVDPQVTALLEKIEQMQQPQAVTPDPAPVVPVSIPAATVVQTPAPTTVAPTAPVTGSRTAPNGTPILSYTGWEAEFEKAETYVDATSSEEQKRAYRGFTEPKQHQTYGEIRFILMQWPDDPHPRFVGGSQPTNELLPSGAKWVKDGDYWAVARQ